VDGPRRHRLCQNEVVADLKQRGPSVEQISGALAPTVIGIEACGASHHWARILRAFGHVVKLIAPQLVKPYVKRGKNDTADAEALCEAMSRPTMRFVPVKTAEQQAVVMMVGLRDRLIRNRTQLSNAVRGYAAELPPPGGWRTSIRCSIAFKLMRGCPSRLASCSRPKLKNMRSCRRKSPKSTPSSWPGTRPMNAADASPISRHRSDRRDSAAAENSGTRDVSIGAAVRGLDRLDRRRTIQRPARSGSRAGDEALRSVLVVGASAVINMYDAAGAGRPGSSASSSANPRSWPPWRWPTKWPASPGS